MNTTTDTRLEEIARLLLDAVPEVFSTMLSIDTAPQSGPPTPALAEEMVAGSVGFIGDVNGVIYLHFTAPFASLIASLMLDMPEPELDPDLINDTVGELANIIGGSVKSRLCDSGSACSLTIPSVVRGLHFHVNATGCPERRLLPFTCSGSPLLVEIQLKP